MEEGQNLRPNNNFAPADAENSEQLSHNTGQDSQAGVESSGGLANNLGNDTAGRVDAVVDRSSIIGYEDPIVLTQSTHSFLFTEPTFSLPFLFALGIVMLSYTCLVLALYNNIADGNSPGNFMNVPVGVTIDVKVAQYLSLLVGLIMEEEIPEALYLLRMISERTLHNRAPNLHFGKFAFCAVVRIVMGYLFYFNMFTVVAQSTAVIEIFFDVLALQFLQQVDDIAFRLAKMDVFGKRLKRASTRKCFRATFERLPYSRRKKMTIFVKALYVFNFCVLMAGMAVVTIKQNNGDYHCKSITVHFEDYIWENALVLDSAGGEEEMDLIYSYFNGVYVLDGTHAGRPVYTEQNKFDNTPYDEKIGAVIRYCEEEGAWAFMHENIRKDRNTRDSDCPWLLRSPDTKSFNLLEVSGDWSVWTGIIHAGASFQTYCNGCGSEADCNYHGTCTERQCGCDLSENDGYPLYTGIHCEFSRPCLQLVGDGDDRWNILPIEKIDYEFTSWNAYGRGVYKYAWGGNVTIPEDDALLLTYSGSRWFGSYYEGANQKGRDDWLHYAKEYHAFWDEVYKENTQYVSNPTDRSEPIAVDFFTIGRRGAKYGPLGELVPLREPVGTGYFECPPLGMLIGDFVSEILEKEGVS